jgi:integrase
MIALQKDCVHLLSEPDSDGLWGELEIRRGLKRDARRRTLSINRPLKDALVRLLNNSQCDHVFTALTDQHQPLSVETLGGQARDLKARSSFHRDAGLHALRHTFLTQLGRKIDAFTLMHIAGHSNIATTQRYVHPQAGAMRQAFSVNMVI